MKKTNRNILFATLDILSCLPVITFMILPSVLCYHMWKYPRDGLVFLNLWQTIFFSNMIPFVVGLAWLLNRHGEDIAQSMPTLLKGKWLVLTLIVPVVLPIILKITFE